ncbi:hypothetical protein Hanom_Chr09g00790221 [Helianthus anomalus]
MKQNTPKLKHLPTIQSQVGGIVPGSCLALPHWTIILLILFYFQFKITLSSFV